MALLLKIKLDNQLNSLKDLYEYFLKWSDINTEFRIDGISSTSPANPSQWIFFKIEDLLSQSYSGFEKNGKSCCGLDWNGIYYLSGGTRTEAILFFIERYKICKGNPNKIFKLSYTSGKEGYPGKRRLELAEYVGAGWNCIKYKR